MIVMLHHIDFLLVLHIIKQAGHHRLLLARLLLLQERGRGWSLTRRGAWFKQFCNELLISIFPLKQHVCASVAGLSLEDVI